MSHLSQPNKDKHLLFLDSARGIAALLVCISHYIDRGYHDSPATNYLFFIFNGNEAVSFFFVLSGFVLSYKYLVLNKPIDIKKFWVTRVFRLFPAYFLTIVINTLLSLRHDLNFRNLINIFILNKYGFWQEAILLRFHNLYYFPGWTLTMEMCCSLIMPFFIILAFKDRRTIFYFFLALLFIGNSMFYCSHFLLGTIISCYFFELTAPSFRLTKWYKFRYIVLFIAIILFSIRRIDKLYPLWPSYKSVADFLNIEFFLYSGLASFVFVAALLISPRARKFLENKVLVFIGKISYSIYLIHTFAISLVYIYIVPLLPSQYPPLILLVSFVVYSAIMLILATLVHRYVELPFMAYGRKLTGKMKPSIVASK
jgi:peptidoglycan/LPS O-acetylase OafA/YrhL